MTVTRRRRQVRRSYGRNAETVPDDDESYHETSSESDVEEEGQVQASAEDGPEDGHDCVENDRQGHGASGDTNCSLHLQSIFSKLLDAKEEDIRSSQQCVSYERSLHDKFETLSERREVMLFSLNETEETDNAEFQAVYQRFLLSHENFRPEDGGFSEKALTKFKSEVSGLGSLLHKRRIDGEELADNGVKRAKVEGEIAELMTWPEDNTCRRLVLTNNT